MSKAKPIYLDYASTTPVDERVAKKMLEYMTFENNFGNAASRSHSFGWQADEAVELARSHVANLVNCDLQPSGVNSSPNIIFPFEIPNSSLKSTNIIPASEKSFVSKSLTL